MGTDKAFLEFEGTPLWRHQLQTLQALQPSRILFSCQPSQFEQSELPSEVALLPDRNLGHGALPAFQDLLQEGIAPTEMPRLMVPIDAPNLTAEFLRRHFLDVFHAYEIFDLFSRGFVVKCPLLSLVVDVMR